MRSDLSEQIIVAATLPSLAEIENDTVSELLKQDEATRTDGDFRRQLQTPEERAQWPDLLDPGFGQLGMAEGHLEALQESIEMLAEDFRDGDTVRCDGQLMRLLGGGIPNRHPGDWQPRKVPQGAKASTDSQKPASRTLGGARPTDRNQRVRQDTIASGLGEHLPRGWARDRRDVTGGRLRPRMEIPSQE
ncbi:hypothetical protein [Rhizobium phaseoli]|uniref:hypothetical protein n=1 Tax=Rhizobium phaseoli TaxID=396 RepID=UPI003CC7A4DF